MVSSGVDLLNFVAPIIGDDALNKAYAFGSKSGHMHRTSNTSSGTVDIVPDETSDSIADGNPIVSVPEPSTLILLGSALGAAVLYKRMRSRKRSKNS
jgi:hypothetical protein